MEEQGDVLKRFYESLRKMDGHFHVLEHRVPLDLQMEYFKNSNRLRREAREMDDEEYGRCQSLLLSAGTAKAEKRRILSALAVSRQVRAYRLLERYVQQPDAELVDWAYLALMESRVTLEWELSEEKQVYISTGLGGKGEKLRFYVLILSNGVKPFLDYQREVVEKEFAYYLPKKGCEIERLTVGERHIELVFLVPVKAEIRLVLENLVRECNVYGNFLSEVFMVTNVKELAPDEVEQVIEKYGNVQTSR